MNSAVDTVINKQATTSTNTVTTNGKQPSSLSSESSLLEVDVGFDAETPEETVTESQPPSVPAAPEAAEADSSQTITKGKTSKSP